MIMGLYMKKVLIISNEETADSLGDILLAPRYGLGEHLQDIPNLVAKVRSLGDFQVEVLHHTQIGQMDAFHPDYVVLSGIFTDRALSNEEILTRYAEEIRWLKTANIPVLGICMGLQLICASENVFTVPIRDGRNEFGFTMLHSTGNHPFLTGIPRDFRCLELHRRQAERLPDGYELLASSELCAVQMIINSSRPIVGVQFHPELTDGSCTDGLMLLKRFFDYFA